MYYIVAVLDAVIDIHIFFVDSDNTFKLSFFIVLIFPMGDSLFVVEFAECLEFDGVYAQEVLADPSSFCVAAELMVILLNESETVFKIVEISRISFLFIYDICLFILRSFAKNLILGFLSKFYAVFS